MNSHILEVPICRQQRELMTYAELSNQRIYRPDLHSAPAALVTQCSCRYVIITIRTQEGNRREAFYQVFGGSRSDKSLKQFLKDQSSRYNDLRAIKGLTQGFDFRCRQIRVASEGQRPDAGIYEQRHERDLSDL